MKTQITWKSKDMLPNVSGFKFVARKADGSEVNAEVTVYGPNKLHTTKGIHFRDIKEWRNV